MSKIIRLKAGSTPTPISVCSGTMRWIVYRVGAASADPYWLYHQTYLCEDNAMPAAASFPITCIVEINLPEIEVPSQ